MEKGERQFAGEGEYLANKQAILKAADLVREGAELKEGRLEVTGEQEDRALREMETELHARTPEGQAEAEAAKVLRVLEEKLGGQIGKHRVKVKRPPQGASPLEIADVLDREVRNLFRRIGEVFPESSKEKEVFWNILASEDGFEELKKKVSQRFLAEGDKKDE